MKLEEIEKYLKELSASLNTEEYSDYDYSELNYYRKNISSIREALKNGILDPEKVTQDLLKEFINDGFDIKKISDEKMTPLKALRSALEGTASDIADKARNVEQSELNPKNNKEGKSKDD